MEEEIVFIIMSYRKQGAEWNQADEGNIWMEASHLSKCEISSFGNHFKKCV